MEGSSKYENRGKTITFISDIEIEKKVIGIEVEGGL
jgi:hypothetical protein